MLLLGPVGGNVANVLFSRRGHPIWSGLTIAAAVSRVGGAMSAFLR